MFLGIQFLDCIYLMCVGSTLIRSSGDNLGCVLVGDIVDGEGILVVTAIDKS